MGNKFKLGYSGKLHSSEVYCDNELMITADVVDLLNEQDKEIKELSDTLDNMVDFKNKYRDKYKQLKKENEQLKSENMMVTGANKRLKENNKRLKEEIKDLNDVLARYEEKELKE